jgi:TP901 family phage tail tape measure protein
MAQETAIAYGIEFYVGRRSRDKAISDVRAAGELVNQNALNAYKKGAQQRQAVHDDAVKKLRTRSKTAMDDLAKARNAAAKQASASFDRMKPPTVAQLEEQKGRKLSTSELESYSQTFGRELKAMEGSMASFVERSGKMGIDLGDATDTAGVMENFAKADVQDRTRMIADLEEQKRIKENLVKTDKKQLLVTEKAKREAVVIQKQRKKELEDAKKIRDARRLAGKNTEKEDKQVRSLAAKWGHANTAVDKYTAELEELEAQIKENQRLGKADEKLIQNLTTLQKKLTAEERKSGRIQRDIRDEERRLGGKLREDEKKAILQYKERNRLMQEYSRHIDEAAQKIGGTLKAAFVVGTAAIAALNYKLMAVVGSFQEFEKQLVNANSIWQESNETLFKVSDSVVNFGTKFGVEMNNATSGLYQYASAGVSAAEAMQMLTHTLKLSMAVQGDHNTLSKLTTQTIMGFNMEFSDAEKVTDKFAHAINMSLIEWDDLASSIKFALPFFISTGQSLDQLLGGLQVLTNRALEAGIAGRGLRQALAEFTQHADDNSAAFRKLGVEIMDLEGNMKPLNTIAEEFNVVMGEGVSDMEVMIALMDDLNVRGATAFVHLVQNADEFTGAVNDLQNSAGSATAMAEIQQTSLANQIQVVKNALMAPFLLSDKVGESQGYLNEFALEMHSIVDVIENLFIKRMADGTVEITKLGETIRDFVIGALHQAKEVIIILVDIIQDFTARGHDMTGMMNAFAIPLKIVLKLMRKFGDGLLEAVILYKMMNGILPLNNLLLAENFDRIMMDTMATSTGVEIHGSMVSVREAEMRIIELQTMVEIERSVAAKAAMETDIAILEVQTAKVASNYNVAASIRAVMFSQMGVNLVMFASIFATQKYAKNNEFLAATIGALAGAYVGMAIGMKLVGDAATSVFDLGARFYATVAASAVIGAGFNVMMQKLMTPPKIDYSQYQTMDTGGRFMGARTYDMGGFTQEHGLAMLQAGETVTSKTGNMLGGGITINMGDVYANDGADFADKLADELPIALQRVSDRGGI